MLSGPRVNCLGEMGAGAIATSSMKELFFRDAASKVIFVENQVSLGAGDTVTSKLRFEEWL